MIRLFPALMALILFSINAHGQRTRGLADTVGFAHTSEQMEEILKRMETTANSSIDTNQKNAPWKTVICPHDDYSYAGPLYPVVLKDLKAKTIICIGVAHKARQFALEDKIIFDSFQFWKGPYGEIKVSTLREKILSHLPKELYIVHDEMQSVEHSVEGMIPFIQHYNRNVEIISILVPPMSFEKMKLISEKLSRAISESIRGMTWGKDFAFAISSDAVHYGDQDWGGKNFAFFGSDPAGNKMAVKYENEIISECLEGEVSEEKIRNFNQRTVQEADHREYKWTWCGRYSVPFGLLTSLYLSKDNGMQLNGSFLGYMNSIDHDHIKVSDIGMGVTAPANNRHWVGYAGMGYE